MKEINLQVSDVRSDALNSDLIKTETTKLNDHNESVSDENVSIEMTEIKQDISLDEIKGEPGLDTHTSSNVSFIYFIFFIKELNNIKTFML